MQGDMGSVDQGKRAAVLDLSVPLWYPRAWMGGESHGQPTGDTVS